MEQQNNGFVHWLDGRLGSGFGPALFSLLYLTIVAFLMRRFVPEHRRHLRFGFLFFLLLLLCTVIERTLLWLESPAWAKRFHLVGNFFLDVQIIHLTGAIAFFLVIPRMKINVPEILRDLISGTAYFLALLSMLRNFGVEIWSLLATSAVASIVIGVSLQPTLASIFGGVALQIDGSIREGDWVRLPDKQEGKVRGIRWRHTLIETRNGDTVILPNAQLIQAQILVLGRREGIPIQRRMWVYFYLDMRFEPERVLEIVNDTLQSASIENVSSSPRPDCVCMSLATSAESGAAQYAVRYWLLDLQRDDPTSSLVMMRVHAALRRAGIPLALPQRRISIFKEGTKALLTERRDELRRRVELLSGVDLFGDLQPSELEMIAGKLKPAPFCKGEEISRQGTEAHWLYILVSGSAEARVRLPSGVEKVPWVIHAPDIFGEFGLMTGAPRRETIVATSRIECLRLDKAELRELLVERPEMAEEFSKKLAERQQRFDMAMASMGETPLPQVDTEVRLFSAIKRFFGLDDGPLSRKM